MLQDEQQALKTVASKLTQRYPRSSTEDVESAVQAAYQRLAGRPIREFVPVLVERLAGEQLRRRPRPTAAAPPWERSGSRRLPRGTAGWRAAMTISCDDDQLR